ncbi:glucose-6-phosphate exchanger SLC37A2 isoform X2 [Diorhabda carinulata]|uniref:glucose-6-phosphate exchanger SLC37A2 isoform X2 n=1 Tax=Diorhabda sublineata TaxID=1163346 RepID=UPI0024E0CA10|nr:glucose-6-phosphate exchanger SLC37A2 isoform X2 [Diorhabda sublineata]XP_057669684.1 glucose-6-phosphate exchanger SLC37A2 isoform X2 [Diorhabda carinulata]
MLRYNKKIKMSFGSDVPWGIRFIQRFADICCPRFYFNRELCYRGSIVFLTYISYMCYHLSRKPISVVKTVLHRNCSKLVPPDSNEPSNWCDWAPFDGTDDSASQMLGELDSSFLFCYAIAMFVSGIIAERVNIRYFLSIGMILSGVFTYLLGFAKTYNIHNLFYYVIVQGMGGIFQTTGWPGVVTVMSNWFGKSKRGLIFGLWNSHTCIGNILGTAIAAEYVEKDWALSFMMPGLYIGIVGFVVFLFLVVNPNDVGCASPDRGVEIRPKRNSRLESGIVNDSSGFDSDVDDTEIIIGEHDILTRSRHSATDSLEVQRRATENSLLLPRSNSDSIQVEQEAIGFINAFRIPGVVEFSLALFFSKLVSYTFLYWLPLYLNASTSMGATDSANFSILFDVGGIIGGIIAGYATDKTDMPAATCSLMLILAAPMMFIYEKISVVHLGLNMILLVTVGVLVNGPYALITTAVAAELGTHHSLEGNAKAMATVTAIIDGTGSIGAAVGPLMAGFIKSYGWQNVFFMLMVSDICALFLLVRLVRREIVKLRNSRRTAIRIE